MTPFEALTAVGRQRRLHTAALAALERYDISVERCSAAAQSFNTTFRVDTKHGHSYALRLGPQQRIHLTGSETVEAHWLAALRHAGLPVAPIVAASDCSFVQDVSVPGVPGNRSAVLTEWISGPTLRQRLTTDGVRRAGALAGQLHEHAAAHSTARPSQVPVADQVLYWLVEPRLETLHAGYGALFTDALLQCQQAVDALWSNPPHPPHLLHGDYCSANVLMRSAEPVAIDFQDLVWGFDVQEIAISVAALRGIDPEGVLTAAFQRGYAEVRRYPVDPDLLSVQVAARRLHMVNLALTLAKPGLEQYVAYHARQLASWMTS